MGPQGTGHASRFYSQARREIVADALAGHDYPPLDSDLDRLVRLTRGMREPDIVATVDRYVESGELPPGPAHPANTCDPYTGNGGENLLDLRSLAGALRRAGFETALLPGRSHRRWIGPWLNALVRAGGLRIAPYVTIYGHRSTAVPSTA